jgi:hypothetical protein
MSLFANYAFSRKSVFLEKAILLLFVFVFFSSARGQNIDALDMQYGIFGVSLESSLDSLSGKLFKGKRMKKDIYVLEKQSLALGQAKLSGVQYLFYKNKLHSIVLQAGNAKESENLLAFLEFFYGPGLKEGFSPLYKWKGKKVEMIYEQNILTKTCEVMIISKAMQEKFEKDWVPAK